MNRIQGDQRGQSEVLGAVLLLGIVVTASVILAGMAVGSFATAEEQTVDEAIERSLLDVRSAVADVAVGGEQARTIRLNPPDGATLTTPNQPTSVSIEHHDYLGNDTEVEPAAIYNQTDLGTLEIEHGDTRYGLEGGGLFKLEDGEASMVAPPNLALYGYTANLQLLRLDIDELSPHGQTIDITPGEHVRPAFPDRNIQYPNSTQPLDNPVYNGSVQLSVTSEYYGGWVDFFEQYTDGELLIDAANNTVTVKIDSIQEMRFEHEITYADGFEESGNADIDGASQSAFLPDSQPLVDAMLEADTASLEEECDLDSGETCTLEAGSYHSDGDLSVENPMEIDTDGGDVELVIDGDLEVSDEITVIGDDEYGVEYYVNGSFYPTGDAVIGTDDDDAQAHRNTIIMAGDTVDPGQGNAELDIVLYAPNADIKLTGNPSITGAIMGNSVDVGGNADISFDADLDGIDGIDISDTDTPIMYLHVTENGAVIDR